MLGLAAASVQLYLLDLLGGFEGPGAQVVFKTIVLLIDLAEGGVVIGVSEYPKYPKGICRNSP